MVLEQRAECISMGTPVLGQRALCVLQQPPSLQFILVTEPSPARLLVAEQARLCWISVLHACYSSIKSLLSVSIIQPGPAHLPLAGGALLLDQASLYKLQYHFIMVVLPSPAGLSVVGEAPLLDQGSLCVLLERVGVLADFQLVYSQLAASCSAMASSVAAFHHPNQV